MEMKNLESELGSGGVFKKYETGKHGNEKSAWTWPACPLALRRRLGPICFTEAQ